MKPHTSIHCFCLLILALTLLGSAPRWPSRTANAQSAGASRETVIPLEGHDPVLLAQGKEVQGDMKFTVTRGQFQYMFASAENKAAFEKDTARYEIQLNG